MSDFIKPEIFAEERVSIKVQRKSERNLVSFKFNSGVNIYDILPTLMHDGGADAFNYCPACLSEPIWVEDRLHLRYKDDIADRKWGPNTKSLSRTKEILIFFDDGKPQYYRAKNNKEKPNKSKAHVKLILEVEIMNNV
jgi:hypothetical protein